MSGGGKETPRQAMIGMMYLFYTALLALNVSAEILSAFSIVDSSLRKTNAITENVISNTQTEFQKAMVNNPAGVKQYKELADEVSAEADKAYNLIQEWKEKFVCTLEGGQTIADVYSAQGKDPNTVYMGDLIQKKDDNNVGGQLFITEKHGEDIENSRVAFREFCAKTINKDTTKAFEQSRAQVIESVNQMLATDKVESENEPGTFITWSESNFEHLPAAGVMALMTKMQSDVRNTESSVLTYLLGMIGKADMKFNAIKAVVSAPKSYLLVGDTYEADVFIAAYDSTQNPEITVNGGSALPVQNGVGKYKATASGVGNKTFNGVIKLKNTATGEIKSYPYKGEYEVGQPSLSVSPTKMNVLYIGVPNPMDITASGYNSEKLQVSISSGSITKTGNGTYSVQVKQAGKATITVSCDGKVIGKKEFRVKRVPDPRACIGKDPANMYGGTMAKASLSAQAGVLANLENFDFDMKFTVTGFTVSATLKGFREEASSNGPAFSAQQKQIISSVPSGQKVYIEDIKAKGPDGSVRNLGALSFKLK